MKGLITGLVRFTGFVVALRLLVLSDEVVGIDILNDHYGVN